MRQKKIALSCIRLLVESSLVDFKRYSGFEEARMPRYFVGLTEKGNSV